MINSVARWVFTPTMKDSRLLSGFPVTTLENLLVNSCLIPEI